MSKESVSAYNRAYRATHPEKIKALKRAYRAKNIEAERERDRQRYAANPEPRRAYQNRYRKEHADQVKARKAVYRAEHGDSILDYLRDYMARNAVTHRRKTREWQRNNPEKLAAMSRRRRARKAGASGSFTAEQWRALCEQYGNACLVCGATGALTADHVIPLSKGGSNDIENIQPLCSICNARKHTQTTDYRKGYPGKGSEGWEVES